MSLSILSAAHRAEVLVIAEACLKNRSEDDFRDVIRNTERIIGQKMTACSIVCSEEHCLLKPVISIMNIGFPEPFVSKITDSPENAKLPLADIWMGKQSPQILEIGKNTNSLSHSDIGLYEKYSVHNIISHGVRDISGHYASYFCFANIPQKINAYHVVLVDILVPHLHAAYVKLPSVKKSLESSPCRPPLASSTTNGKRELPLTSREVEILTWILKGKTNNDIADILNISKFTVKTHIQRAIKKLGATNRQHAVARALELKLIDLQ